MIIFDSRIVHRSLKILRVKFRGPGPQPEVEQGTPPEIELETQIAPTELSVSPSDPVEIPQMEHKTSGIDVTQPRHSNQDATESLHSPISAELNNELGLPYSIRTGLLIFAFFVATFVSVMVTRGVINNLPLLYRFFANILLAGISHVELGLIHLGTIIFGKSKLTSPNWDRWRVSMWLVQRN